MQYPCLCFPLRLRRASTHLVIAVLSSLAGTATLQAQTNPNVVEFLPSPEHNLVLSTGQPAVSGYQLWIYQNSASEPYMSMNLGKPAIQADGLVRVNFSTVMTAWPLPNIPSFGQVAVTSPNGPAMSLPSNTFVYACGFSLSSNGLAFSASGGSGSVQITTDATCGWRVASSASWITTASSTTTAGPGSINYQVAANTGSTDRSGTLDIAGLTYTVIQTAAAGTAQTTTTHLSDRDWTSMTNGLGPVEKNHSNGDRLAGDGGVITLNGRTYAKGLGTAAASTVRYALNGACSTFQSDIGVDDELGGKGSVTFQVVADGVKLFDSGVVTGSTATRTVSVNVAGKRELVLTVVSSPSRKADHADWADARVTCTGGF
jgi:hypothetical protein